MRRAGAVAGLALLMAAGTRVAGWWAVPLLAAGWGAWCARAGAGRHGAARAWHAAVAAAAAWGGLLLLQAGRGPVAVVADRVGAVMGVPPVALVLSTLVFATLCAWPVAVVAAAIVRQGRSEQRTSRRVEDPAARASSAA